MQAHDQHESFIKTPQQLIVVILLSFLVPIIAIVLLVQLVLSGTRADPNALAPEAIEQRIQPVARLEFGVPGAAAGERSADQIVKTQCATCHQAGVANAPKFGDAAAWAPRIQTGIDSMVQSVIKGKGAMPPRAGNPALSDAEIRAAADFMVSQSK